MKRSTKAITLSAILLATLAPLAHAQPIKQRTTTEIKAIAAGCAEGAMLLGYAAVDMKSGLTSGQILEESGAPAMARAKVNYLTALRMLANEPTILELDPWTIAASFGTQCMADALTKDY